MAILQHGSVVTFGTVKIGTHSYAVPNVERNLLTEQIPRAEGVYIKDLGGGQQSLSVAGWITQETRSRMTLIAYLQQLLEQLSAVSAPASLYDFTYEYSNCFFQGLSYGTEDRHWATFSANFLRSIA